MLRDHHDKWIVGFKRRLGFCSVFNAELWGILDGLTVLHNKNWDKMLIGTDILEAIQAIQVAFSSSSNSALVKRTQQMLLSLVQWEMIYTLREENIEADCIAKLAFNRDEGLHLFAENPLSIW